MAFYSPEYSGVIVLATDLAGNEVPSGTIDGNNAIFTLAHSPSPTSSLNVYRGGARQKVTEDYTLVASTLTFNVAPSVGEIILVDYLW